MLRERIEATKKMIDLFASMDDSRYKEERWLAMNKFGFELMFQNAIAIMEAIERIECEIADLQIGTGKVVHSKACVDRTSYGAEHAYCPCDCHCKE